MANKVLRIVLCVAFCGPIVFALGRSRLPAQSSTPNDTKSPSLLTQRIGIHIPSTTFLNALLQIGRSSGQCLGVVLIHRSTALAEAPGMNAEHVKLGDVIGKVLESVKGFAITGGEACLIIGPGDKGPRYLKTTIPLFRSQRSPLELQSYNLFQALAATEPQPEHRGAWGTVASVSASTDSPEVGPMDLEMQSVEAILCRLAEAAGRTMWVAFPKGSEAPGQFREPWRFVRYARPDWIVREQLRELVEEIPDK